MLDAPRQAVWDHLCQHHDLDHPDVRRVLAEAVIRRFESRAHLVEAGESAPQVFFIIEGLVRLFFVQRDGREHTKAFHREGQFTGAHAAAMTGEQSDFFIEALEPTTTVVIEMKDLDDLSKTIPAMQAYLRRAAEHLFWFKEKREAMLLTLSATERYQTLQRDEAWLPSRVAQKHLASYLGMTPVSLSRIRKQLREG